MNFRKKLLCVFVFILKAADAQATSWSSPVVVYEETGCSVNSLVLDLHPSNHLAVLAWVVNSEDLYTVCASSLIDGTSWQTPSTLSSSTTLSPEICIKIDGPANALALWNYTDGDTFSIQSSDWQDNTWAPPLTVSSLGTTYYDPQIKLVGNSSGTYVLCWETESKQLQGKTYDANNQNWGDMYALSPTSTPIQSDQGTTLWLDKTGNLSTVFTTASGLWINQCNAQTPPSSPSPTYMNQQGPFSSLIIQSGTWPSSQGAMVVCQLLNEYDNLIAATNIFSGRILTNWSYSTIFLPYVPITSVSLATNPNSSLATAAWQLSTGPIQAAIFDGVRWTEQATFSNHGTSPAVAVNASNNHVIVVWADEQSGTIQSSEYDGEEWGAVQTLSEASTFVGDPQICIDSKGYGIIAWRRLKGSTIVLEAVMSE